MSMKKLTVKKKKRKGRLSIIALIIFFSSLIFLSGCATTNFGGEKWKMPNGPEMLPVSAIPIPCAKVEDGGYYLSEKDAENLADNVDELKAHVKKLNVLIRKMKKYYGSK